MKNANLTNKHNAVSRLKWSLLPALVVLMWSNTGLAQTTGSADGCNGHSHSQGSTGVTGQTAGSSEDNFSNHSHSNPTTGGENSTCNHAHSFTAPAVDTNDVTIDGVTDGIGGDRSDHRRRRPPTRAQDHTRGGRS